LKKHAPTCICDEAVERKRMKADAKKERKKERNMVEDFAYCRDGKCEVLHVKEHAPTCVCEEAVETRKAKAAAKEERQFERHIIAGIKAEEALIQLFKRELDEEEFRKEFLKRKKLAGDFGITKEQKWRIAEEAYNETKQRQIERKKAQEVAASCAIA
jgi:hypothetical protein